MIAIRMTRQQWHILMEHAAVGLERDQADAAQMLISDVDMREFRANWTVCRDALTIIGNVLNDGGGGGASGDRS